jgi:hypothetical protein
LTNEDVTPELLHPQAHFQCKSASCFRTYVPLWTLFKEEMKLFNVVNNLPRDHNVIFNSDIMNRYQ